MQSQTIDADKALRALPPDHYAVNEIFYSVQGEGILAGTPMVFIRFADCNLRCSATNAGFDCDTEFMSGRVMSHIDISAVIDRIAPKSFFEDVHWFLLTGGEPALQVSAKMIALLRSDADARVAIETNGTIVLPDNIDHICVSPKSAEHTIRQRTATEVKYVRRHGQAIPQTVVNALVKLISPAAQPDGTFKREDVEWCTQLVLDNPTWRLSMQQHKIWGVR